MHIKSHLSHIREGFVFLRRFTTHPGQIGSVTPSSRFLTRAMLERVDWSSANFIAELGAGTGVFTREIVKLAKPDAKILVFEIDPALQKLIKQEHSGHNGVKLFSDAQELEKIMKGEAISKFDVVISSLPFTVLPHKMSVKILDGVRKCLKPNGHFIAYQYSSIMKPRLQKRFKSIKTKFVLLNVPPAFVYDCSGKK